MSRVPNVRCSETPGVCLGGAKTLQYPFQETETPKVSVPAWLHGSCPACSLTVLISLGVSLDFDVPESCHVPGSPSNQSLGVHTPLSSRNFRGSRTFLLFCTGGARLLSHSGLCWGPYGMFYPGLLPLLNSTRGFSSSSSIWPFPSWHPA